MGVPTVFPLFLSLLLFFALVEFAYGYQDCSAHCNALPDIPISKTEDLRSRLVQIINCMKANEPEEFEMQMRYVPCKNLFKNLFGVLYNQIKINFEDESPKEDIKGIATGNIAYILWIYSVLPNQQSFSVLKNFVSSQGLTTVYDDEDMDFRSECLENSPDTDTLGNRKKLAEYDSKCFLALFSEMKIGEGEKERWYDVAKPFSPLSALQFYLSFITQKWVNFPNVPKKRDDNTEFLILRSKLDNILTAFYYLELGSYKPEDTALETDAVDLKNEFEEGGTFDMLGEINDVLATLTANPERFRTLQQKVNFILYGRFQIPNTDSVEVVDPTQIEWRIWPYWRAKFNYFLGDLDYTNWK